MLKPGGRFAVSDVVVRGEVPAAVRESMELWVGCIAGALEEREFARLLTEVGFENPTFEPTRFYAARMRPRFLRSRDSMSKRSPTRSMENSSARSCGPRSRHRVAVAIAAHDTLLGRNVFPSEGDWHVEFDRTPRSNPAHRRRAAISPRSSVSSSQARCRSSACAESLEHVRRRRERRTTRRRGRPRDSAASTHCSARPQSRRSGEIAGSAERLVERIIAEAESKGIRALYLLTTTAERYFPSFGFAKTTRDAVPAPVQQTAEFQVSVSGVSDGDVSSAAAAAASAVRAHIGRAREPSRARCGARGHRGAAERRCHVSPRRSRGLRAVAERDGRADSRREDCGCRRELRFDRRARLQALRLQVRGSASGGARASVVRVDEGARVRGDESARSPRCRFASICARSAVICPGPTVILVHGAPTLNTLYLTEDRADSVLHEDGGDRGGKGRRRVAVSGTRICRGIARSTAFTSEHWQRWPAEGRRLARWLRHSRVERGDVKVEFVRVEYDVACGGATRFARASCRTNLRTISLPAGSSRLRRAIRTARPDDGECAVRRWIRDDSSPKSIGTFFLVFIGPGAVMVNAVSNGAISHAGVSLWRSHSSLPR